MQVFHKGAHIIELFLACAVAGIVGRRMAIEDFGAFLQILIEREL